MVSKKRLKKDIVAQNEALRLQHQEIESLETTVGTLFDLNERLRAENIELQDVINAVHKAVLPGKLMLAEQEFAGLDAEIKEGLAPTPDIREHMDWDLFNR